MQECAPQQFYLAMILVYCKVVLKIMRPSVITRRDYQPGFSDKLSLTIWTCPKLRVWPRQEIFRPQSSVFDVSQIEYHVFEHKYGILSFIMPKTNHRKLLIFRQDAEHSEQRVYKLQLRGNTSDKQQQGLFSTFRNCHVGANFGILALVRIIKRQWLNNGLLQSSEFSKFRRWNFLHSCNKIILYSQETYMIHALRRVSFSTCLSQLFAFAARDPGQPLNRQYCHVFRTPSVSQKLQ